MKLGSYEVKLEKKLTVTGWEAAIISILAILIAMVVVSFIFLQAKVNPLVGYEEDLFLCVCKQVWPAILTISRSIFMLLCTCAFIVPMKAGLWNIGMAGQLYAGALGAFAVAFAFGRKRISKLNPFAGNCYPVNDDRGYVKRRLDWSHSRLFKRQIQYQRDRRYHDAKFYIVLVGGLYDQGRKGPLHGQGWGRGRF